LPREREGRILAPGMKYIAIIVAIVAVVALSQFLYDFYDWNKTQTCASTGGRNCGGAGPIPLSH
jgi:hypothetical protein